MRKPCTMYLQTLDIHAVSAHLLTNTLFTHTHTQLAIQLMYTYNQVLSVLTNTQLQQIFEKNPGFDLRYLLQGSEKFVDNILNLVDSDPSFILSGVSYDQNFKSFPT